MAHQDQVGQLVRPEELVRLVQQVLPEMQDPLVQLEILVQMVHLGLRVQADLREARDRLAQLGLPELMGPQEALVPPEVLVQVARLVRQEILEVLDHQVLPE
jgi:hypothetical protein